MQTSLTSQPRFTYDGMQLDQATGLYYDNARYYDSSTGRFVSQDPLGFAGGTADLYAVVRNDPVNLTDTSGLTPAPAYEDPSAFLPMSGSAGNPTFPDDSPEASPGDCGGSGTPPIPPTPYQSSTTQSSTQPPNQPPTTQPSTLPADYEEQSIVVPGIDNLVTGNPYANLDASDITPQDFYQGGDLPHGQPAYTFVTVLGGEGPDYYDPASNTYYHNASNPTAFQMGLGGLAIAIPIAGDGLAATEAAEGASSYGDAVNLNKSLASMEQVGETGTPIIGSGTDSTLLDADRLAEQYGGNPENWAKMTSSNYTASDGTSFETHWYENTETGQQVEFKTKLTN